MIIEQTNDQIRDAVGFHTHAELASLRLAQARVWSRDHLSKMIGPPVDFDINFKVGKFSMENQSVLTETEFIFAIYQAEQSAERKPAVVVECSFEAEYRFADGFIPSEEQIGAFRSANAVFNCWPFFREFVQSSVTRMHFPAPPVPFLRIIRKIDTSEITE